MSYGGRDRRGYGQPPFFRETLSYQEQLRDQIRVFRDYANEGYEDFMGYALDQLEIMLTPDILDAQFDNDKQRIDEELEDRHIESLARNLERRKAAADGAQGVIPGPFTGPDKQYLQAKFYAIVQLLQRKRLLLKQSEQGEA